MDYDTIDVHYYLNHYIYKDQVNYWIPLYHNIKYNYLIFFVPWVLEYNRNRQTNGYNVYLSNISYNPHLPPEQVSIPQKPLQSESVVQDLSKPNALPLPSTNRPPHICFIIPEHIHPKTNAKTIISNWLSSILYIYI